MKYIVHVHISDDVTVIIQLERVWGGGMCGRRRGFNLDVSVSNEYFKLG